MSTLKHISRLVLTLCMISTMIYSTWPADVYANANQDSLMSCETGGSTDNGCKISKLGHVGSGVKWKEIINQVLLFGMASNIVYSNCKNTLKFNPPANAYIRPMTAYITPWLYRLASLIYIIGEIVSKQRLETARKKAQEFKEKCDGLGSEDEKNDCWLESFRALKSIYEYKETENGKEKTKGIIPAVRLKKNILTWSSWAFTAAAAFETVMIGVHIGQGAAKQAAEAAHCADAGVFSATAAIEACAAGAAAIQVGDNGKALADCAAQEAETQAVEAGKRKLESKFKKKAIKMLSAATAAGFGIATMTVGKKAPGLSMLTGPLLQETMGAVSGVAKGAITSCMAPKIAKITSKNVLSGVFCGKITSACPTCKSGVGAVFTAGGACALCAEAVANNALLAQYSFGEACYCQFKNVKNLYQTFSAVKEVTFFATSVDKEMKNNVPAPQDANENIEQLQKENTERSEREVAQYERGLNNKRTEMGQTVATNQNTQDQINNQNQNQNPPEGGGDGKGEGEGGGNANGDGNGEGGGNANGDGNGDGGGEGNGDGGGAGEGGTDAKGGDSTGDEGKAEEMGQKFAFADRICAVDHYYYAVRKDIGSCDFIISDNNYKFDDEEKNIQIVKQSMDELGRLFTLLNKDTTKDIVADLKNTKTNSMAVAKFQNFIEGVTGQDQGDPLPYYAPNAKINEMNDMQVGPLLSGLLEIISELNEMVIPKAQADETGGVMSNLGMYSGLLGVLFPQLNGIVKKATSFLIKRPLSRAILYGSAAYMSFSAKATAKKAEESLIEAQTALTSEILRLSKIAKDEGGMSNPNDPGSSKLALTGTSDEEVSESKDVCMNSKMAISVGCNCKNNNSCWTARGNVPIPNVPGLPDIGTAMSAMAKTASSMASGGSLERAGVSAGTFGKFNAKTLRKAQERVKDITEVMFQGKAKPLDLDAASKQLVRNLGKTLLKRMGTKGMQGLAKHPLFGGKLPAGAPSEKDIGKPTMMASYKPYKPGKSSFKPKGMKGGFDDFGFDEAEDENKVLDVGAEASKEESLDNFEVSNQDIQKKPGVSIFKIISSRYIQSYDKVLETEEEKKK